MIKTLKGLFLHESETFRPFWFINWSYLNFILILLPLSAMATSYLYVKLPQFGLFIMFLPLLIPVGIKENFGHLPKMRKAISTCGALRHSTVILFLYLLFIFIDITDKFLNPPFYIQMSLMFSLIAAILAFTTNLIGSPLNPDSYSIFAFYKGRIFIETEGQINPEEERKEEPKQEEKEKPKQEEKEKPKQEEKEKPKQEEKEKPKQERKKEDLEAKRNRIFSRKEIMNPSRKYYNNKEILLFFNLKEDESYPHLKKSYRRFLMEHHPDKVEAKGIKDKAEILFAQRNTEFAIRLFKQFKQ